MKKTMILAVTVLAAALMFAACDMLNGNGGNEELSPLVGSVSIEGTPRVGLVLTAVYSLEGTGAVSFQWMRGNTAVGTNSPTYTILNTDVDSRITVTVTRVGFSGSVISDPTDPVTMPGSPDTDADEIDSEGTTLVEQLDWLRTNAQDNRWHIIEISGNESIAPQSLVFDDKIVGIILRGNGEISLTENGSLFAVGPGVTLRLDGNITLRGSGANNAPLVLVASGGTLIMERDVVVTGNVNTSSPGGGVSVHGAFTMRGGEISYNTATSDSWTGGGGVFVNMGGVFEMEGGIISNNTADNSGGVHVGLGSTFIMHGGEISDNTTGGGGGGVNNHGTFSMYEGSISGNTAGGGGGGVLVFANAEGTGVFNMRGGSISSNNSTAGGGVLVVTGATFDMHGGAISGNTATIVSWTGGGGVNVGGGTFNMHSGSISGNTTIYAGTTAQARAGGVLVGNTGTFTMLGGQIYDNETRSETTGAAGGGVFVDCGDNSGGVFNMRGGSIRNNTAYGGPWANGGGVSLNGWHIVGATFRISDGTICDSNMVRVAAGYQWSASLEVSTSGDGGRPGSAVAQHGTFPAGVFSRIGDLHRTGNTLEVVNGVLQVIRITLTGIPSDYIGWWGHINLYDPAIGDLANAGTSITGNSATFVVWGAAPGARDVHLHFNRDYGQTWSSYGSREPIIFTLGDNNITWSAFDRTGGGEQMTITVTEIPPQYNNWWAGITLRPNIYDDGWGGSTEQITGGSATFTINIEPGMYYVELWLEDGTAWAGYRSISSREITSGDNDIPWSAFDRY